eukprot:gene8398-10314_t
MSLRHNHNKPHQTTTISNNTQSIVNNNNNENNKQQQQLTDDKWKKWWIRTASTIVLLFTFISIIYLGHIATSCLIIISNLMVYNEIITLGQKQTMAMYFLIGRVFYGRFTYYFQTSSPEFFGLLSEYHIIISFLLYIFGFIVFVFSLEVGKYKAAFLQIGWVHCIILSTVLQTSLWISNIFQGFIWFILPTGLVMLNDTFAYVFGFFFGKTRLIEVSPRKTWEGFIGGMFSTIIGSYFLSTQLSKFHWMICPKVDFLLHPTTCIPAEIFTKTSTPIGKLILPYFEYFGITSLPFPPIVLHAFVLALFASLVAPYGGFFASGLKRAFGIKDFGNSIPGHGGITDRTDCQFLMGSFTYIYLTTFIRRLPIVSSILSRVSSLSTTDQLEIYYKLQEILVESGTLQLTS